MAGVKHLKSLPYVDGDRLAIHGWSFGGFMTSSLMLREPGTFNVGVALSGMINVALMVFFVPLYGIQGAIYSVLVAEVFCCIYMILFKLKGATNYEKR